MRNTNNTPPCSKCPYKLGTIKSPINPCRQCKRNNFRTYHYLTKEMNKEKQ